MRYENVPVRVSHRCHAGSTPALPTYILKAHTANFLEWLVNPLFMRLVFEPFKRRPPAIFKDIVTVEIWASCPGSVFKGDLYGLYESYAKRGS